MHILDKITAHKKKEVAERRKLYPTDLLETSIFFETDCVQKQIICLIVINLFN